MIEPIKAGDDCIVIDGALGKDSPNIGKEVTVIDYIGDHSVYGRIWRCSGKRLISEFGCFGSESQFAQSWLQKKPKAGEGIKNRTVKEKA